MVPSLILVQAQLAVYNGEYQAASTQNSVYEKLEQDVQVANGIAEQLVTSDVDNIFSNTISEVEGIATGTVVLNSIAFIRTDTGVESVLITGEAASRSLLVQFRDTLEDSPLFESAALPLANLAKDKDVPFSITIIFSNQEQE
jgi:hypothetical protein